MPEQPQGEQGQGQGDRVQELKETFNQIAESTPLEASLCVRDIHPFVSQVASARSAPSSRESRLRSTFWISGIRGRREKEKRAEPEGGSESQKERKEGLPSSTKTLCITLASLRNCRLFA